MSKGSFCLKYHATFEESEKIGLKLKEYHATKKLTWLTRKQDIETGFQILFLFSRLCLLLFLLQQYINRKFKENRKMRTLKMTDYFD